jgi:diguanylate cyclase (GGDEF)-like protein
MYPQRVVRAGPPVEVTILALMTLVRGAGCLLVAAFPPSDQTPTGLLVVLSAISIAIALVLVLAGARIRPVHLHAAVALSTMFLAVMVAAATTERGMMLSAIGYLWTTVYVALFFRPAAARLHSALMTAGLGIGLLVTAAAADVTVWLMLSAMIWVGVAILGRLSARLHAQAHTDDLTGLLNRTGFALAAARQRAIAARGGESLALAVIDLDDFKAVNDHAGHAAGDRLQAELASAWAASLRPADVLARYGGDEFVLLLPGATEDQAERVLARLAQTHPSSWTAGVVLCSTHESLDEAIARADERLYGAKASRRQAVAVAAGRLPGSTASRPEASAQASIRVVTSTS